MSLSSKNHNQERERGNQLKNKLPSDDELDHHRHLYFILVNLKEKENEIY